MLDAIRTYPKQILLAMGARFAENGFFYIFTNFVYVYATTAAGLPRGLILTGVMIATAIHLFLVPTFGALSDRMGRRPLYLGGAIFVGIMAFPFFRLIDTQQAMLVVLAIVLGIAGHAMMYGPQASFFSELFGTRVRYSGASLGYQLASVFAGGLSPLIATALLASSGNSAVPIAMYMIGLSVVSVASVLLAVETSREDIAAEQPAEHRRLVEEGLVQPA